MIAPVVFTPSSEPGLRTGRAAIVAQELRCRREGESHHEGDREHRQHRRARTGRRCETRGRPGPATRGCEITRISPATLRIATAICENARTRTGSLIRGRRTLNVRGTQRDPDEEQREDDREDVRQPARSRREQPGPCDLVAERRQTRDERDDERQPDDRPRPADRPRSGSGAGRARAAAASVSGRAPGLGDRASSRASHSATTPAMAEHSAPIRSAPLSPNNSMRTRPATQRADDRAQGVREVQAPERLAQRRRPSEMPDEGRKVAPIMIVAGASARTARTRRARARNGVPSRAG